MKNLQKTSFVRAGITALGMLGLASIARAEETRALFGPACITLTEIKEVFEYERAHPGANFLEAVNAVNKVRGAGQCAFGQYYFDRDKDFVPVPVMHGAHAYEILKGMISTPTMESGERFVGIQQTEVLKNYTSFDACAWASRATYNRDDHTVAFICA